jgi:hypothetical protein
MIKITSVTTSATDRLKRKKAGKKDDDSGFSSLLGLAEDEAATTTRTAAASPVQHMSSLLSMQEVSDEDYYRRQAVQQAGFTLDELEKLRDALLSGAVPVSLLRRIETMIARQRPLIQDPVLTELLDHIELRAAVELAKLEQQMR